MAAATEVQPQLVAQIADVAVLLASDLAGGMTATVANATGGAQVD